MPRWRADIIIQFSLRRMVVCGQLEEINMIQLQRDGNTTDRNESIKIVDTGVIDVAAGQQHSLH